MGSSRPRWLLRRPPLAWLALGLVASMGLAAWPDAGHRPGEAAQVSAQPVAASAAAPLLTFVSIPDFLNTDIGDARLRAGRGWDPGDPTSTTASWTRALDVILDRVKRENPSAVLVAGDLVEGHWGEDVSETGIFGPVTTSSQRTAAVTNAGNLYYGEWRKRFRDRRLRVLPAIGDHEVGDNPWPAGSFDLAAVPTYKKVWARHFTRTATGHRYRLRPVGTPVEDTAYAVRIANTLLVTVDMFRPTPEGMRIRVGRDQLTWLDRLMRQARSDGVRHIVVQGHAPVLGPVRHRHSSQLRMRGIAADRFWRLLDRHDVDLYLAGEMHDMTTLTKRGVVQVVHGGLATFGELNYLVGHVYRDRIVLRLEEFRGAVTDDRKLWNTSWKRPVRGVSFQRDTRTVGTMVIDKRYGERRLTGRTGRLRNWH